MAPLSGPYEVGFGAHRQNRTMRQKIIETSSLEMASLVDDLPLKGILIRKKIQFFCGIFKEIP